MSKKAKVLPLNQNPTLLLEKEIGKFARGVFDKNFRKVFENVTVSNSKKGIPKGYTKLEFFCKENSSPITNGRMIERFQNECLVMRSSDPKRLEKPNIMPMIFETSDARAIKKEYGEALNIVKLKSQGANAILEFDVTDIKDRNQLIVRIAAIYDAKLTVSQNLKAVRDKKEVERFIKHFNNSIGNIEKTHNEFKRVTGQELINLGYATIISKFVDGFLYRVARLFNDKVEYYFFDRIVNKEEEYIIKLRTPQKIEKTKIDWEQEFWLRYEYGEQVFPGGGFLEIDAFQIDILEVHNKRVEESKSE